MEPLKSNKKPEEEDIDDHLEDLPEGGCNVLSCILGGIFCPFTICGSLYSLQEREEAVILRWGKYETTVADPGIHFTNCFGREMRRVMKTKRAMHLQKEKVVDGNGNPLVVSGIVTFFFESSKRYALNVTNAEAFIQSQATAVMKQIVSRYPYESQKGHCLKSEPEEIGQELVQILQKKVAVAGARIVSFQFNELSYAPEIAGGMLKKQQAGAMVEARNIIVRGAVDIAYGVVQELETRGIAMDAHEKVKVVTNLVTVMTGEHDVTPTLSV